MRPNASARQGLFSKVQIAVDKVIGNKAYLTLNLRQQPRISEINYHGVKKVRSRTSKKLSS